MIIFFSVLGLFVWVAGTQAADNMTGTWNCLTDSPIGKGTPTLVLQQDGEKITGQYQSSFGEFKIMGSSQGSDFELHILLLIRGTTTSMIFKGKIDGDKISGVIDMKSRGKGTFTGERVK
jgi:D-glucosaminate-6-phosphate ammonia-lyase